MNDNPDYCPECGKHHVVRCRCLLGDRECENGHAWHECLVHGRIVLGRSDHSKDTYACHCEDEPYV